MLWGNAIIPLTMKLVRPNFCLLQFLVRYLYFKGVSLFVELCLHFKSCFGGGLSNKFYHILMAGERPATPVHADVGKKGDARFYSIYWFQVENGI
jgi:hypothetical protein